MAVTLKNIETARQLEHVHKLLLLEGSKCIAVAYVDKKGLALIQNQLVNALSALNDGQDIRLFIDLQSGNTEPDAVHELVSISENYPSLKIKAFHPWHPQPRLHAKLFLSHSEESGSTSFLTGSYNLTEAALKRNREHGLFVECGNQDVIARETLGEFEKLWEDHANTILVNKRAADNYQRGYRKGGDDEDKTQDPNVWQDYRDREFTWPSEETAFLMGTICARCKFIQTKRTSRIEISLQFRARRFTDGQIKVRGTGPNAIEALRQVPLRIQDEARKVLPRATIRDNGRQKVIIECSDEQHAFDAMFRAYRKKLDSKTFSLPTYIGRANKSVVRNFIGGFAAASALIDDNTRMPGRGDNRPYVVWLNPPNDELFPALQGLIQSKLGVSADLPRYHHYQRSPRKPYCVRILAEDFRKEIKFGIEWWDNLVRKAADHNHQLALNTQRSHP